MVSAKAVTGGLFTTAVVGGGGYFAYDNLISKEREFLSGSIGFEKTYTNGTFGRKCGRYLWNPKNANNKKH